MTQPLTMTEASNRFVQRPELFDAFRHASSAVAVVWNRTKREVEWVDGPLEGALGYTPQELWAGGWAWLVERVHPSDQGLFDNRACALQTPRIEPNAVREWELRIRHRNGGWRWFRARVVPFGDTGDDRVLCLLTDVTEKRRAEDGLLQSEERFRALMEHSNDLISILDAQGNLRYNSPAGERLLGFSRREFIGRNIFTLMHPEDLPRVKSAFRKLLERPGEPQKVQVRFTTKDERWVWMECVGVNQTHHPAIQGLVTNTRDISDQKQAEAALAESLGKYRELAELLPETVFEADQDGRFVFMNAWGLQTFGFVPEDLGRGLALPDFVAPESRNAALEAIQRTLNQAGAQHVVEVTARRKDGVRFPISLHLTAVVREGEALGLRGIAVDLTEHRKSEAEWERIQARLRESEKMEAIGQLAGGIAHDFNNQLATIMGFAEMLQNRLKDADQLKCLDRILSACHRSADLTQQLLAFARKGRYLEVPVDVDVVVGEVVQLLQHSFDKRIAVEQVCDPGNCWVLGDPNQLENALMNLAFNARDAMPSGGRLRFTTRTVQMDEGDAARLGVPVKPGPQVQIRVEDSGTGMPPEVKAHLFEPFFTTKDVGKGTGLGLASVYGTVKAHGGVILVQSTVGKGTTIDIYLPMTSIRTGAEPTPATPLPPLVPHSVLVVDDEPMVGELLVEMLKHLGYVVDLCIDGVSALDRLRQDPGRFDGVILDLMMPNLSGLDTYRAIQCLAPGLPVIISSGFSQEGEAQQVLDEGARAFLQKPYQLSTLARTLSGVFAPEA